MKIPNVSSISFNSCLNLELINNYSHQLTSLIIVNYARCFTLNTFNSKLSSPKLEVLHLEYLASYNQGLELMPNLEELTLIGCHEFKQDLSKTNIKRLNLGESEYENIKLPDNLKDLKIYDTTVNLSL